MKKIKENKHLAVMIGGTLLAFVVFVAYKKFFPNLDLQGLLNDFANFIGAWTYLIAALLSFAETGAFVGLVLPGETLLIVAGAVAGQGVINLYLLIAIAWAAAVAGDSFSYLLGRKLGNAFLVKHGPKLGLDKNKLDMIIEFFDRHGGKTILIGRFIGLIRAFAPFIAGSSNMAYRKFIPYSILGTGIQTTMVIVLGYLFSKNIEKALDYVGKFGIFFGVAVGAVISLFVFAKFIQKPENRSRLRRWALKRPSTAWSVYAYDQAKPGIKFFFERFQPGEKFGLELTSFLSVFAVSSFVVVAYVNNIAADPELVTFGDRIATDVSAYLSSKLLDDLANFLVAFGSRPVLGIVAVGAAAVFIWRHSLTLLAVLVLSTLTLEFGSDLINELILRPASESFPNHSAALSIIYVWLAIVFITRIKRKSLHSGMILLSAIVFTALIGLSGVYLGDNYMSDSNAGWAYGAAVFSFFSVIFMLFGELHHEMRLGNFKRNKSEPENLNSAREKDSLEFSKQVNK